MTSPVVARKKTGACRLYAILARDGKTAVVFRRGPTRWVALISWKLADDTFQVGQWLHGRIYERRCDLSPDGSLLVYFAGNWKAPMQTWTAVSRPPWLTALALWKKGDAWGGGGLFDSRYSLKLNHGMETSLRVASGFRIPPSLKVGRIDGWGGRGEDHPILDQRMLRDGWLVTNPGEDAPDDFKGPIKFPTRTPRTYERTQPLAQPPLQLRLKMRGHGVRNGPWNLEDFSVVNSGGLVLRRVTAGDWADWDQNGDLLFAFDGRLYRVKARDLRTEVSDPLTDAIELADFWAMKFEAIEAPESARRW